jgi:hypothetical protein
MQHIQGKYSDPTGMSNMAHIVGNGSEGAPSNAHTLDWEGNAWFAGNIRIGGTKYDNGRELITKEEAFNFVGLDDYPGSVKDYIDEEVLKNKYNSQLILTPNIYA